MKTFGGSICALAALGASLGASLPAAAAKQDKRVCVEVLLQETGVEPGGDANEIDKVVQDVEKVLKARRARTRGSFLPLGQNPVTYLKRLIEHFVTHEDGFVAVQDGCQETINVELYPLSEGWTAFARYSGHGREERVDRLLASELSAFAERSVLALLEDRPISTTIKRDNVLRADSLKSIQTVKGSSHFALNLTTRPRFGQFQTSVDRGGYHNEKQIRPMWPIGFSAGYLGKYENWGIEALATLNIGTSKASADNDHNSTEGGHIDYGGDAGVALHFLYYFDPRGLTSFFLGAGSTFELIWFSAVKPEAARSSNDPRTTILGGGLNIDLMLGYEFMRASTAQFRLQVGIHLPAFVIENEDKYGNEIDTWFPAASVGLGVMF